MVVFSEKTVFRLILVSIALAVLYRIYPVTLGPIVLRQAFMTEDGYLMLTIARNMAIGLGMSVSDGTIASNGVQPLATFLFAVPFLLTDGNKVLGVAGVQLISAAIAIAGIFTTRAFFRLVLARQDDNWIWPWMLAALWFASPTLLQHTMNGLETGLYTVMLTLTLVIFYKVLKLGNDAGLLWSLLLGLVGGITFLARNDAIFLLFPMFAIWFLYELHVTRQRFVKVFATIFLSGMVIVLIAAPWLINNYVNFGSIVPVSGTAQALSGGFAKNVNLLPAMLFEYAFPMLPVPNSLQTQLLFKLTATTLVIAIVAMFIIQTWRRGGVARYIVLTYLVYSILMSAYYGFYFGAGWFLSRYLSPLAPFLMVATFSVTYSLISSLIQDQTLRIMRSLCLLCLLLCFALLGRLLVPGVKDQGHFQVVDWITENVSPETWVGAVQTGTLGYWHDRTINLDGKVNPDALQAILTKGHFLDYVLQSKIEYLADWHGISTWVTEPTDQNTAFSEGFALIVHQPEDNLAVLKRR